MQTVTILGSTGSIGISTLDVLSRHPERYHLHALTANSRWQLLAEQCLAHRPRFAVLGEPQAAQQLIRYLADAGCDTRVLCGDEALATVVSDPDVTTVMAAIVGAAGLLPTLAAVRAGKKVLLANKEALVMAGDLFVRAVRESGATLLPIDSEHNAIFQCLCGGDVSGGLTRLGVRRILLTASGGPFWSTPREALAAVTPEQACAHPNWSMGQKISVDSATMMNKGLELIEACWLFGARPEQIEVVVHPQSVVHSMVEYVDGSVLAQMGNPDMRTPIAHALAWPERMESGVAGLDIVATARLDFAAPDEDKFPCLRLARQAADTGGTAPALLNAANEVAVAAFLAGKLRFDRIALVIEKVMQQLPVSEPATLDVVQTADSAARDLAARVIADEYPS